jgi:hypothetical protein
MVVPGNFLRQNGLPKLTVGAQVVDIVNLVLARECPKMEALR